MRTDRRVAAGVDTAALLAAQRLIDAFLIPDPEDLSLLSSSAEPRSRAGTAASFGSQRGCYRSATSSPPTDRLEDSAYGRLDFGLTHES